MRRIFQLNTLYILIMIIAIGILVIPRFVEGIQLHSKGISYVTSNMNDYYHKTFPIEGKYTVEINVDDLKSNEGRVLFEDSDNQIYVTKVRRNGSEYEIIFKSSGSYDADGATLVSGLEHARTNKGFTSHFKAEAEAMYKGVDYEVSPSGFSAFNDQDGDQFGFHFSIDVKEEPTVIMTVSQLQVNLWARVPE
ncbi:hypothetical protein LC065_12490 [Halobacillus litoralis]|uniref:hypothetical protein n=1 Tax=Halobacillus litoralis TaxID=45668 RepID=UPI001CFD678A|nr:hypothetical protein [Halobacillus litoralis]WLR46396.1 hypothetical protein LC065_12490 [Halobacillus litoralis]